MRFSASLTFREQVRQRFFLHAVQACVERLAVGYGFDLRLQAVQGGHQKAACAAGKVGHAFAQLRINHLHHKVGDGARGVKLARIARALQAFQDGFVDVAKGVALFAAVKVDFVDFVNELAQQRAVFHEVFGVFKHIAHDAVAKLGVFGHAHVFQRGDQFLIDKAQQRVARERMAVFAVACPVFPSVFVGDDGLVAVFNQRPILFFVAVDFEEEQPGHLLDALCVAVDARVAAHDVLHGFYESIEAHKCLFQLE